MPTPYVVVQVTALAAGRLEQAADRDTLLVGSQTNLLAYDVEKNADIYYKARRSAIVYRYHTEVLYFARRISVPVRCTKHPRLTGPMFDIHMPTTALHHQ